MFLSESARQGPLNVVDTTFFNVKYGYNFKFGKNKMPCMELSEDEILKCGNEFEHSMHSKKNLLE